MTTHQTYADQAYAEHTGELCGTLSKLTKKQLTGILAPGDRNLRVTPGGYSGTSEGEVPQ